MTWQPPPSGDPDEPRTESGGAEPPRPPSEYPKPPEYGAPPPPPPPSEYAAPQPEYGTPPPPPSEFPPAGYPPPEQQQYAYQNPPESQYAYQGQGYQPYPVAQPRGTNGLAVASLVCSLAGLFVLISAPIGAVLGHMALRQIQQTGEEGAGLAKAGIIIGWIITGLVVVACCIGVIALFAAVSSSNT